MEALDAKQPDNIRQCYRDHNLQIMFAVTLMSVLGASAFIPAFPKIAQELKISPQEVGLLISAYAFPGMIFAPFSGILADRFGRRKVLAPSLILFSVAGVACAFTRDFNLLLILRFLQGLGAYNLIPMTWIMICDLYSEKERTVAMGYNASFLNIGMAIFPTIGGALAMFSWHYAFLLSALAAPVGLVVLLFLKNPEPKNSQHLGEYLRNIWQNLKNIRALCLFLANTFAFILVFGSFMAYFPFLSKDAFGASSFLIGLLMSTTFFVAAFAASQLGRMAKMASEVSLLKVSFALYALGLLAMPFVTDLWLLLIPLVIFGVAQGINEPIISGLLGGLVPMNHRAGFIFFNELFLQIGATSGPILMGIVFGILGISSVFLAGAGLSVFTLILIAIFVK